MTETNEPIKIHRGLKGVYFDRSPCTFIDGRIGELRYRGYSIHDLAEHSTFEETAWLLLHGELPTKAQLTEFDGQLKSARELPAPMLDIIRTIKTAHPMDVLRTATSALAGFDPETADNSRDAVIRKGIRLTSQVPMIVAAHARLREGLEPVAASKELSHAANLLWMLKGEKPSADAAQLIDRDLVLHAEHGSNASSFTARVVVGTEANLHAADHRGNRGVVRTGAWRRRRGRDEDGRRDRRSGARRRLCARQAQGRRSGDRLRPSRLSRRGSARAPHARRRRASVEGDGAAALVRNPASRRCRPWRRMRATASTSMSISIPASSITCSASSAICSCRSSPSAAYRAGCCRCSSRPENNILIRPLTLYNGPDARPYVPIERRPG